MTKLDTRYLSPVRRKGRLVGYYYQQPKDAREQGIFKGLDFNLGLDKDKAEAVADEYNQRLDLWRAKGMYSLRGSARYSTKYGSSFEALCDEYRRSMYFSRLRHETQTQYKSSLRQLCRVSVQGGITLAEMPVSKINTKTADDVYQKIHKARGPSAAKHTNSVAKRVMNIAMKWDKTTGNPFAHVDVDTSPPRETVWTPKQIKTFCAKAVEKKYSSIALIATLQYDLMQRHVDVRNLTWDNYQVTDDGPEIWLQQTKRDQRVWLPLSEEADAMIQKVSKDQEYICANEITGRVWQRTHFCKICREIMRAVGISDSVGMHDLRRTAATEAGMAGATDAELMAVGGWRSREMVSVYTRPTRASAIEVQKKRQKWRDAQ